MANTNTKSSKSSGYLLNIIAVGLMAALVYVGNYIQFKIPNGVLVTRIHLGNSMCLLAGLLFGARRGGLASGIGAMLFDLFDPVYIVSAPYTFFSKFAMGWAAGLLNRRESKNKTANTIVAAIIGQLVYIVLYLIKSFFTVLIIGGTAEAAWTAVGTNAITSSINGVLAVIISVPLYFALKKALKASGFNKLIEEKTESKGYFNPVTIGLTIFAVAATAIFSIKLSTLKKVEKAEAKEKAALESRLEEYEKKFDLISEKLGIDFSEIETPAEEGK